MGPQGPQGENVDTGGIDPIELAQAHHIAWVIDDADAAMGDQTSILRVGEDQMVSAVVGAQSGKKLPSVTATVTLSVTKDDNEAITLEDGMISAVGVGKAEITAMSAVAGLSSKLTVTVTKPVAKIVFMVGEGDDATAADSEYFLAEGQSTDEITAVAHNEDDEKVDVRSNWSWSSDDTGVATVKQKKDGDDLAAMGSIATITGAGTGDATISAMVEGVSGSIDVSVTGQTITRILRASTSDTQNNTFVWDRTTDPAASAYSPATIVFRVSLYDDISRDEIAGATINVASSDETVVTVPATVTSATAGAGGVEVTVTPAPADPNADPAVAAGSRSAVVTLTTVGADPVRINFTVTVKGAPSS